MRQAFTFSSSVRSGTRRRSLTGSLVLAMILAFIGRPGAAEEPPADVQELARLTVVSARLMGQAKALEALGAYGYSKGASCMYGAAIAPGESVTMRLVLNAGEDYLWFAAGDGNTQDLDIEVIAPDGDTVAKDISSDAVPCIQFSATQSGKHCLKLSLFKGTGTSFCAVVLMQRDGWAIPLANLGTAFSHFVVSAGSTAMLLHEMSEGKLGVRLPEVGTGWCLFGGVMKQRRDSTIENLSLGKGLHVFLAAGCDQATDIDLEVIDQNRQQTIVSDKERDATPMGMAPTDAKSLYQVSTSLPDSRGAALVLTGILKVQPANPVAVLIQPAADRW